MDTPREPPGSADASRQVPTDNATGQTELVNSGKLIIDVRSPQEYATGHIRGAINVPYDRIAQQIGTIEGVEKTTPILLYCLSGARSAVASNVLAQLGYGNAVNGGSLSVLLLNNEYA